MQHIVIDGYNMMHASRGFRNDWTEMSLEEARRAMINFAVARRQADKQTVTIVFDGASGIDNRGSTHHGVEVIFSEPGIPADDVIKRIVAGAPRPKSVLVITADREIKSYVQACGACTISPDMYLAEAEKEDTRRRANPPEPREKFVGPHPGEIDRWRKVLGFDDGAIADIGAGGDDGDRCDRGKKP